MKILLVTDAWAPQINGPVRVQNAHIKGLEARGYEVAVIEPSLFTTIPTPFYHEVPLALFARRRVATLIDEIKPDAIHIVTEGPLGWAARSAALARGLPFTTWYHSHFQLYVQVQFRWLLHPAIAFIRRFHSAATRVMVSTETLKGELESIGYKNVIVVPLGVDTELFTRTTAQSLPALPTPVFMYLGRIAPEKSVEEFLRLDLPGTKLVIGDGPDRARLERMYGTQATFVGYKTGTELVQAMSLADVFVFPSRTETFGLVVLEALACGIPVAAHDVMGPRDSITHGKDGYLSADLREAALSCLKLSPSDCRAKALRYSWDHSTDLFIKNLARRDF